MSRSPSLPLWYIHDVWHGHISTVHFSNNILMIDDIRNCPIHSIVFLVCQSYFHTTLRNITLVFLLMVQISVMKIFLSKYYFYVFSLDQIVKNDYLYFQVWNSHLSHTSNVWVETYCINICFISFSFQWWFPPMNTSPCLVQRQLVCFMLFLGFVRHFLPILIASAVPWSSMLTVNRSIHIDNTATA